MSMDRTLEVVVVPVADVERARAVHVGRLGFVRPGSLQGLQLVVRGLRAARDELPGRCVEVSEMPVFGATGARPAQPTDNLDNVRFLSFSGPDGNGWAVQQISARR